MFCNLVAKVQPLIAKIAVGQTFLSITKAIKALIVIFSG